MTQKDIIKLALISKGFVKDIRIDTYKFDDGDTGYDVYASTIDGEYDFYSDCDNFLGTFIKIVDIEEHRNWQTSRCYLKYIMDDDKREPLFEKWYIEGIEEEEYQKLEEVITKPYFKWIKKNNPCSDECPDNKHDCDFDGGLWHHCMQCAQGGTNTKCGKLNQYRSKCEEMWKSLLPDLKKAEEESKNTALKKFEEIIKKNKSEDEADGTCL